MLPVDAGSAVRYTPPPPPPPLPHTVAPHDTVASVAKTYNVTPKELARTNHITVDTGLTPGQQLQLPSNAVQPAKDDTQPDKPPTPAEKTDAAISAYEKAVKDRDDALRNAPHNMGLRSEIRQDSDSTVSQAKTAMDQAIGDEIAGEIASRNQSVPGQFRTPTDQIVTSAGNAILARHQGDAVATPLINGAAHDYQIKAKADALIPGYSGDWSAADKLKGIDLTGQPKEVVDAVLADPRVQGWIKDAATQIGQPYDKVPADHVYYSQDQATQAANNLATATQGMPPELATEVTRASLPTIQKISQLELGYAGSVVPFDAVHGVLTSLGNSDAAQSVINQAAGYYAHNPGAVGFLTRGGTNSMLANTVESVYGNANPAFAIALAKQVQAHNPQAAGDAIQAAEKGIEDFQGRIKQDLQNYADMTKELNWLVSNNKDKLTPDQMQKAIDSYVKSKGPDWQKQFDAAQQQIITDTKALAEGVTQLKNLPDDLKSLAPGLDGRIDKNIGDNETTRKAIEFTASKDPSVFEGEAGNKLAEAMVELGHKSKDTLNEIAKAYISGHVLPAVQNLNPNDAASVSKAQQALNDLRGKAAMFGIPQNELDDGVNKLNKVLGALKTESLQDAMAGKGINALGEVKNDLGELKDTKFTNPVAGLAFRTMAFGLSGAALLNSAKKTVEDPNAQNVLGTLAFSAGLAQDTAGFGASMKLLDSEGALAKWGTASSVAGELTEKFIGVLNIGYFAVGAAQDASNTPKLVFDVAGTAGATLATFGEAFGAGAWAGPVGVGVTLLATAGLSLAEYRQTMDEHTKGAKEFLASAGVNEEVAKTLSGDALKEASSLQGGLGLSAGQLQELAEQRPELFQAPNTAQSFIDVAKACGIQGDQVSGFAAALAKDSPDFVRELTNQQTANNGAQPLTHSANLVDFVLQRYPTAKTFLQQHQPDLTSQDGTTRRQADRDYEIALATGTSQQYQIGNLLKGNSNPVYQTEIIQAMQQRGSLDNWVRTIATSGNGWPEAAKSAIQTAQSSGVLSADDAQKYLSQLG